MFCSSLRTENQSKTLTDKKLFRANARANIDGLKKLFYSTGENVGQNQFYNGRYCHLSFRMVDFETAQLICLLLLHSYGYLACLQVPFFLVLSF